MLLIIQIAAGIVLGFVIITYRAALLRYIKWIAAFVAILALIGLAVWIGSEAVGLAEPYLGKIISKIGMIIGVLVLFGVGALGGLSFRELVYQLGWRKRRPSTIGGPPESAVILASLANILLVYAISWPILQFTLVGGWYESIDQWSRENGFADGGALLATAIFWLWPALPLWLLNRRKSYGSEGSQHDNSASQSER
jgi:hypothetical protein